MLLERRQILGAAMLAAAPGLAGARTQPGTLAAAAAQSGRFFGAAAQSDHLDANFLRQCSSATPELALKMAALAPVRGELRFDALDVFADKIGNAGLTMHGHALLWHKSVPAWTQDLLAAGPDWNVVRRHFASVIPRYGEVVRRWDVVNEPIETGQREDGLRDSIFLRAFGPDYIARALREARTFAPKAELFINEFDLEYDHAAQRDRRYLLLKLIERLKTAGAPLDGLGFQAHLDLAKGAVPLATLTQFLKEVANFGLTIHISELDVREQDRSGTEALRDMRVADETRRFLDVALSNRAVIGVTCWGLSDRFSWLNKPGVTNRGLPFNADNKPKPMFDALLSAFAAAPARW